MFENKTEQEARNLILEQVVEYCDTYHNTKDYQKGDSIPYALSLIHIFLKLRLRRE